MKITVTRRWFTDRSTIGELSFDSHRFCYTLEDQVHDGPKIDGRTAIPAGTYQLAIDKSARFQRYMPHILAVPGFAGIRIHSGNTAADTEGCLLLGLTKALDAVFDSRVAFTEFMQRIATFTHEDDPEWGSVAVWTLREPTTITIVNQPEAQ